MQGEVWRCRATRNAKSRLPPSSDLHCDRLLEDKHDPSHLESLYILPIRSDVQVFHNHHARDQGTIAGATTHS